jgi:hypothetical protein
MKKGIVGVEQDVPTQQSSLEQPNVTEMIFDVDEQDEWVPQPPIERAALPESASEIVDREINRQKRHTIYAEIATAIGLKPLLAKAGINVETERRKSNQRIRELGLYASRIS